MATYRDFEADLGYSHDVNIVKPNNGEVVLKKIYTSDLNGSDYSVQQTKFVLLSEFNIDNAQDYVLVLVKRDNSRIIMNDSDSTEDYIHDIASDSFIRIERRQR